MGMNTHSLMAAVYFRGTEAKTLEEDRAKAQHGNMTKRNVLVLKVSSKNEMSPAPVLTTRIH